MTLAGLKSGGSGEYHESLDLSPTMIRPLQMSAHQAYTKNDEDFTNIAKVANPQNMIHHEIIHSTNTKVFWKENFPGTSVYGFNSSNINTSG